MSIPILKLLHAATPDAADAELLGRFAAARDEAAFTELVRRHGPVVYRVCRRLVPASADDAFQATFLVLACRASSVRKAASVGSWLIGVAGRVARQMARREARRQGTGDRRQLDPAGGDLLSPVSCLLSTELSAILDDELTRLPDHYRAPVVLCLVNGQTQEQAAAELGGSVRTLRRRLDQAKALLRVRLERRGVVPAVAVALVAGAGTAAAVPPELGRLAVRGVFEFLAGGAAVTPAAVIAKGVVGSMANLKATALVAAAAAVLIGLGVGAAQQAPQSDPPPNVPLRQPVTLTVPALGDKPVTFDLAAPTAAAPGNRLEASFVHRSANFLVSAPTAVIARAVAAEAEFQREQAAKQWLGGPLPALRPHCNIEVNIGAGKSSGTTTFNFTTEGGKPTCGVVKMRLEGTFESVLSTCLPHEVTHVVLAQHFGKPLPRWADEGIALLAEGRDEQAAHDTRGRELLNGGRGIQLRVLFRMTEYPRDMLVLYAQGHSVVRFLLSRTPEAERVAIPGAAQQPSVTVALEQPGVMVALAPGLGITQAKPRKPQPALLEFLRVGMDGNTATSWDKAAKDLYGFESVDALQEAWLEWLRKPESLYNAPPKPNKPKDDGSGLIPPTKLPGVGDPPAAIAQPRPVGDAVFSATRKISLPVAFDSDKNPKHDNLILYVSRDKCATWVLHGVLPRDKPAFV